MLSKFRFDRGPLRGWLLFLGVFLVQFEPWRFAIGEVLVVLGAVLHFVSKGYLEQERILTTSGPYRFTRNPFYLANLIIEIGLLTIIGSALLAGVYLGCWFVIYGGEIRAEEAVLRRLFGGAFDDYCRAVGRLFPRPGRILPRGRASPLRFSLYNANILGGREIQRSLRILSLPLILFVAASIGEQGLHWRLWPASCWAALTGLAILQALILTTDYFLRRNFTRRKGVVLRLSRPRAFAVKLPS